ncbi:hypothetical protein HPP92_001056 [Vanilla planifolia]|uniref:Uncharacterized protein n=1 Tax=Vanilla planifolia TaxID=51239 RepID=A0A835S3Y2_VANPL|nr:hypothetical protein HPP92_001056 [Vanilla planifolia]
MIICEITKLKGNDPVFSQKDGQLDVETPNIARMLKEKLSSPIETGEKEAFVVDDLWQKHLTPSPSLSTGGCQDVAGFGTYGSQPPPEMGVPYQHLENTTNVQHGGKMIDRIKVNDAPKEWDGQRICRHRGNGRKELSQVLALDGVEVNEVLLFRRTSSVVNYMKKITNSRKLDGSIIVCGGFGSFIELVDEISSSCNYVKSQVGEFSRFLGDYN